MKLHSWSRAALYVGAVGSLALMFYAGRHNTHLIIFVLFTGWVLIPFVALGWAHMRAERWSPSVSRTIDVVILLVTVGTLGCYVFDLFWPRREQAAYMYVIVAPVATVLAALAIGVVALFERRS